MTSRMTLVALFALIAVELASAQAPPVPPPMPAANVPPARDAVAARVNGQAIPEMKVYRALLEVPPQHRAKARQEVISYFADNVIVDQYLVKLKVQVDAKEIEESIQKIKSELAKGKRDFNAMLKQLSITEDEIRTELAADLRWEKFVAQQGNDKVLQQFFTQDPAMFNGSTVRARHILIPIKDNNKDVALTKTAAIKKAIEAEVAQTLARLPVSTDAFNREKARAQATEKAFIKAAETDSTCDSKKNGGDLGFFVRIKRAPNEIAMVEPFARVAFALKPFQMSDPVQTEFGYHLILTVEVREGKAVAFAQVKDFVRRVYGDRLRDAVLALYKPQARIEIVGMKK